MERQIFMALNQLIEQYGTYIMDIILGKCMSVTNAIILVVVIQIIYIWEHLKIMEEIVQNIIYKNSIDGYMKTFKKRMKQTMEEKKIEKLTARCKTCVVQFEYLKSQRKNAQYCSRACYNEFLKRPSSKPAIVESITINKKDTNWVKELFSFLTGK